MSWLQEAVYTCLKRPVCLPQKAYSLNWRYVHYISGAKWTDKGKTLFFLNYVRISYPVADGRSTEKEIIWNEEEAVGKKKCVKLNLLTVLS